MSRLLKQGLDYFFLNVETDDKVELIEAKHGIAGFGILIKLFQKIYKEGYYINWNEDSLLLFSKRINVDRNKVNDVINDFFVYNLLNETLYNKYNILTSYGIQTRYLNAVDRRKDVKLIRKYIVVDINQINANINWINDDKSTQSRVEESRVEESRQKLPPKSADFIQEVINVFMEEYPDYKIISIGKERAAAGKILQQYKKECPNSTSEETLQGLKLFFHECISINDPWLYDNMSLPIIVSKFNTIIKIIKNGNSKFKKGATNQEIFTAITKNFATNIKLPGEEHAEN